MPALLAEIHKALGVSDRDQDWFQSVFAHRTAVALEAALNPGEGYVPGKIDAAVALADEVTRGLERSGKVIKTHLVELLRAVHANYIVTEGDERHVHRFDSLKEVWINGACENDAIDQAVLLKNGGQVDLLRSRSGRIVQHSEQHVLFQAARVRLNALQNAGMKGV